MMIAARRFALCERQDLDYPVVDRMLYEFRVKNPGVMFKNQAGHWHFDKTAEASVRTFLQDSAHVDAARQNVSAMALYASGKKKGRAAAVVRLTTSQGVRDFTPEAASKVFDDLVKEIERLQEIVDKTSAQSPKTVPQPNVVQFKKPLEVLEPLAQLAAENPEMYLGARTRSAFLTRLAAEANKRGLHTATGRQWTRNNLNNFAGELEKMIKKAISDHIAKFGKPKIRVPVSTKPDIQIAA